MQLCYQLLEHYFLYLTPFVNKPKPPLSILSTAHKRPATGWKGLKENWRSDFLAAISVALVAMPLGLGIAVASGLPAISGLISAIIGGIVVTLFRGSHLAINGPAAGLIAVVLSAIQLLDDGTGQVLHYVLAAICIAGLIQVLLGVFRLGFIAEIIPSSVIQGIMVAIGIIVFTSQIYVALGIDPVEGNTIQKLMQLPAHLGETNLIILLISAIGLIILFVMPRTNLRILHYFPATLWVLILTIPIIYAFDFFTEHSIYIGSKEFLVGPQYLIDIPDDLTQAFLYPDFSKMDTFPFWVAVISIALIASIQTLAMAKAVDKLDPYRRKSNLNKDLIGVGLGTMVAGAIGGLPVITVIVRSTVNVTNNAKTKWSNFYHGILILVFIVLLSSVIQMVPLAALAAILVFIGFRLAAPSVFSKIYAMGIEQLIFMVVTIIITLYSDLLWGIIGGTLFTLLVHILLARLPVRKFLNIATNKNVRLHEKSKMQYDLIIRGVANFLSIPSTDRKLKEIPPGADVNIDLSDTRLVDMTFTENIKEFLQEQNDSGGQVTLSGLENHVSSSMHDRALKIFLHPVSYRLSPRQQRLSDLADKNGYTFDSMVNLNTSNLRSFQFFEIRPIEAKANCLRGRFDSLKVQWEIADVTFNEGASFSAEVFHSTVMTLRMPQPIPKFVMEKERFFDKIFDRVMAYSGYRDIDFKLYPTFSKNILLMGENEHEIRSFFTGELIEFFEKEQVQHIESNGEFLLIFIKMKLARTDETESVIDFSKRLCEKIIG